MDHHFQSLRIYHGWDICSMSYKLVGVDMRVDLHQKHAACVLYLTPGLICFYFKALMW